MIIDPMHDDERLTRDGTERLCIRNKPQVRRSGRLLGDEGGHPAHRVLPGPHGH